VGFAQVDERGVVRRLLGELTVDWLSCLLLLPCLPLALGFINMCCCGVVCDKCSASPEQMQVTLSGVTSGAFCMDCEDCDGTWTVDGPTGGAGAASCFWQYTDEGVTFCGNTGMRIQVEQALVSGRYHTIPACLSKNPFTSQYAAVARWRHDHGTSPPDCTAFSGLSPSAEGGTNCNATGTCTVTAL
jgi:hypothetical protein